MTLHKIKILSKDSSYRIDKWLKSNYKIPYTLLQKAFRKKDISVNSKRVDQSYILQEGDFVQCYGIDLSKREKSQDYDIKDYENLLKNIKGNILYQDDNILVVNKPYSIAVQNGEKVNLSIDTILPDLCEGCELRLVHRLDRYTTGILIISKSKPISAELLSLFKEHKVQKRYLAVLDGVPEPLSGTLKSKIGKSIIGDKEIMCSNPHGKEAITKYKVISISKEKNLSLVEFFPITGRTHQIRVHTYEELGCSIVGDSKYSKKKSKNNTKMHLHSYKTEFVLLGKKYNLTAPLPDHIVKTLQKSNLSL